MVLLKIHCYKSKLSSSGDQTYYSSNVEDSEDDLDKVELPEVGCELGVVEGQFCNIPYELYNLPDLRELLSIDTWNSCLTEEERISLSAYLPDMDQHTFCLTIKELLGGSNMFFGNPLDKFFNRLKGGLYPPNVTGFREGLLFLEKRKYYHLLKSYHENMVRMFMHMQRLMEKSDTGTDLINPNTYPKDGYTLSRRVNSNTVIFQLPNIKKRLDNKGGNNSIPVPVASGMKFVAPISNRKGVLKIKSSGKKSYQEKTPKSVQIDSSEKCRPAPRGVLKLVSKVPSLPVENSRAVPRQRQPNSFLQWQNQVDCTHNCQDDEFFNHEMGSNRHSGNPITKSKMEMISPVNAFPDIKAQDLSGCGAANWEGDQGRFNDKQEPSKSEDLWHNFGDEKREDTSSLLQGGGMLPITYKRRKGSSKT